MNKGFRTVADRVVDSMFERAPLVATTFGQHAHDRELDRLGTKDRAERRTEVRDQLKELKTFEAAPLSQTEQMDLAVLQGQLQVQLRWDEDIKVWERDAGRYIDRLLAALFHMVSREYGPDLERGKALLRRLQQLPSYLETAVVNLKQGYDIPAIWTDIALEAADGADRFFREAIAPFAPRCPKIEEELADAIEGARRSLLRFRGFIERDLKPRCDGTFAVGRDFYEFLVEREHGLHLKCKDLIQIGEDAVAAARSEMEKAAKDVSTRKALQDILRDIRRDHPKPDKLIDAYRREIERARDFVVTKDLVTLPESDRLTVAETPPFARPVTPYAAYLSPAPFESKGEGFFFVTPPTGETRSAEMKERLENHNACDIALVAVHECYPGHHVQQCASNRATSRVRKVFWTPTHAFGWALYCEDLAIREGFSDDPRVRLMMLRWQLLTACRIVLDVKLHLQQMSFDEAVAVLVETAGLDRVGAAAEVKRYTLTPTRPMSYLIGKREIERLREDYRAHKGERFKLKEFHDRLLSYGTVPPALIRDAMLH